MDAEIINLFLNSAISIFNDMFNLRVTSCPAYVLGKEINHRWEISGLLGITGDYSGIISFRLSTLLADKLLEKSGIHLSDDQDRQDTIVSMVGELTNIISSTVSNKLQGKSVSISPPAVVMGRNHQIGWPKTAPVIAIPFSTQIAPFEVLVCMR